MIKTLVALAVAAMVLAAAVLFAKIDPSGLSAGTRCSAECECSRERAQLGDQLVNSVTLPDGLTGLRQASEQ